MKLNILDFAVAAYIGYYIYLQMTMPDLNETTVEVRLLGMQQINFVIILTCICAVGSILYGKIDSIKKDK